MEMSTKYDPVSLEKKWYAFWEENGCFNADVNSDKEPFTIVIPPPNVTGALHLGHALNNTLQDILIRSKRMQGYEALWMPGTDHAGIATQIKVEEMLAKEEKQSRYDLGRDAFIEKVWEWKHKYGNRIIDQLRGLGCSCDWRRERFTMDEGCSKAVREVFVSLYEKGLIYQGSRITNWCPRCNTALSDIEVEHKDLAGKLYYVKYFMQDSNEQYIEVATTRPETILGDTAIAVNPSDIRYKHLIGKKVIVPACGRIIPIVADEYVAQDFGTGAVKVTPAHDPNDFDMGLRHNLEQIVVIAMDGKMTEDAGKFNNLDRYECRKMLIAELKESGQLVRIEEHAHSVGHCERCDTVIEPLMSKQWFVKMQPLAEPALKVVEDKEVEFLPERFTKIYLNWMNGIKDWCISRQIWWGHQIPAWYCDDCGATIVSRTDICSCNVCGGAVTREEDVLDTWFSSALWPFSTLGWPENTSELKYFYPTSVLVTGYDIIFFWVARMIFSGLEFMGERPFKHVFLTGLVRDAQGRKMSKSLGNGIDPMEVIEKYGADTLRFTLTVGNTPGNDMRFYIEKVEASRNFTNKIWNASRFVLMNLSDFKYDGVPMELSLADKWIISRYHGTVKAVTENINNFEPGEAARCLYEFIWNEFCDWYIELKKINLYNKENQDKKYNAQYLLVYILSNTMKLLHPFMPFISEEIWQHLPSLEDNEKHYVKSIMRSKWPVVKDSQYDCVAEKNMSALMEMIRAIRNMRAELNVPLGKKCNIVLFANGANNAELCKNNINYIQTMASVEKIDLLGEGVGSPDNAAVTITSMGEVFLPLAGLIDTEKELAKLKKEEELTKKEIERINSKLNNVEFVKKAPEAVIEKERVKLNDYNEKYKMLQMRMHELSLL